MPTQIGSLLDVGCYMGGFGQSLKQSRSIEVWGIEPDESAARIAASRLDHVITGAFSAELQLKRGSFDALTFNDSLEHMPDPEHALSLAYELLRPGGHLLCSVPNMRHIESLEHLVLDGDWRYEREGVRDRTHLRFFTMKSIKRLVASRGFEIRDTRFLNERWWQRDRWFRSVLFRVLPKTTHDLRYVQLFVHAVRPA